MAGREPGGKRRKAKGRGNASPARRAERKTTPARKGPSRVLLQGDLTVGNAPALRDALLRATGSEGKVTLAFGPVTRVDLTLLQLLCSLHRSAREEGREVPLSRADLPAEVVRLAVAAGFRRSGGCGPGCLWAEGGHG